MKEAIFSVGNETVRSCRTCKGQGYRRAFEVAYDDPTYHPGFFDSPFEKVKCTACNGMGLTRSAISDLNQET